MLLLPPTGHALGLGELAGRHHAGGYIPACQRHIVTLRGSGDEGSKLLGEAGYTDEHQYRHPPVFFYQGAHSLKQTPRLFRAEDQTTCDNREEQRNDGEHGIKHQNLLAPRQGKRKELASENCFHRFRQDSATSMTAARRRVKEAAARVAALGQVKDDRAF